jgi:hypothetical protein
VQELLQARCIAMSSILSQSPPLSWGMAGAVRLTITLESDSLAGTRVSKRPSNSGRLLDLRDVCPCK